MAKGKRGGRMRGRGGAARRKPVQRRSKYELKESASLTEVQPALNFAQANTNYSQYNLALSSLARAQNVAKGYQYYRITRVTYIIKPLMDTFVAGGVTVPYLYYLIDRTRMFQNGFSVDQLKAMGAKARRLDDKTITFSFTPSVLTETFDNTANANQAVQYKLNPWLPTKDIAQVGIWNPNTTDHQGIVWRVEQASGTPIGYSVERRVQVEFKKPAVPTTVGEPGAVPIEFDEILAD